MEKKIFSELVEKQIDYLNKNLDKEEIKTFEKLLNDCETEKHVKLLLVRYQNRFPSTIQSIQSQTAKIYEPIKRPIRIGYLLNEDTVFYNELDDVICNYLRYQGAEIIRFKIEDIYVRSSRNGIDVYINNEKCDFDGFMSYGYRKKMNMESYLFIVKILQEKGVTCLHTHNLELVLNNKLLQSVHFAKAKIPIPDTFQSFEVKSTKNLVNNASLDVVPCVIKPYNDYCGDGLIKLDNKLAVVNVVSKSIWKGENVLMQKFVPDYLGKSIRVLCFNCKCYGIIEYEDSSGDFRSNFGFGDVFHVHSRMNHPKYNIYKQIAENACKSLGDNCLVAGVDILDSKQEGCVVLEINGWPDLYEVWNETRKCTYNKLAISFIDRIKKNLNKSNAAATTTITTQAKLSTNNLLNNVKIIENHLLENEL